MLITLATAVVSALAVGAAPAASATGTCPGTLESPFRAWDDPNAYVLAPGGDFESRTPGWTLSGGAARVKGNESFFVHRAKDTKSLLIPPGGSATSGEICTTVDMPLIRFFVKGGSSTSALRVDVIVTSDYGDTPPIEVARIAASSTWAPSAQVTFYANYLAHLERDGTSTVKFRFTTLGDAGWWIDDVYIDPRKGG